LASIKYKNISEPDESEVIDSLRTTLAEYLEYFNERPPFIRLLEKESASTTNIHHTEKKRGRPAKVSSIANVLNQIIETLLDGDNIKPNELPGNAEELLGVCQSIAKVREGGDTFKTGPDAFKRWLEKAGYGFKNGRMPSAEEYFWRAKYAE